MRSQLFAALEATNGRGLMRTYVYLEGKDQDPPIRSNGEVGQHLSDLPKVRGWIAHRENLARIVQIDCPVSFGHHWLTTAAYFFAEHPKCAIGIRDEYGREHGLVDNGNETSNA